METTRIYCEDRETALRLAQQHANEWYWHESAISETDAGIVLSYREQLDNQLFQTIFVYNTE